MRSRVILQVTIFRVKSHDCELKDFGQRGSMLLKQPGKPWFHARGSFYGDVWGFGRVLSHGGLSSPTIAAFEPRFVCKGRVVVELF